MSSVNQIPFKKMNGNESTLSEFAGKVVMVVNVASKCGLTPQYEGLEKIYRKYKDQGFEIIGFPANNFKAQEPGSNEEIQSFCQMNYGVTFPLAQKISVKGDDRHPLYSALIKAVPNAQTPEGSELAAKLKGIGETPESPEGILWNFEKFLLNKNGEVVARFAPDMKPDSAEIKKEIEKALAH